MKKLIITLCALLSFSVLSSNAASELISSDSIVKAHNSGKAFFVVDSENTIYAVVYIVYDKKSAYYLLGGASDQEKSSGAVSLALWEAIKFSSKVSTRFDFEGSCNKNIEEFFRGFGGKQKIYFNIWRDKE